MSRLYNNKTKKCKNKRYKKICKIVFICFMMIITISSILIIDYRSNEMLGNDSKNNIIKYLSSIF